MIKLKDLLNEEKPGLWANIRAKQARGEKPAHGNSDAHKDAVKAGKEINKEATLTEKKYYVTYNLGRGRGKDLEKEFDQKTFKTTNKPKVFNSYNDAKKYAEKMEKMFQHSIGGGTAYWVSDEKMNPINESDLKGYLVGDVVDDIIKSIGTRFVSGEIKQSNKNKIYLKLKDVKFGSGVVKMLKSQFGIDAKEEMFGGKDKFGSIPSVSFFANKVVSESVNEATKRDYKAEYKKFQSSTKSKKYRAELNKYNRDKGTYGNGDGKDASHKNGKIVGFEAESVNRGRAEKSRLKKESVNEELSFDEKEMVIGIIEILKQVEDPKNRMRIALNMLKKFKEEGIEFDYQKFMDHLKEYSMGSYEYDKGNRELGEAMIKSMKDVVIKLLPTNTLARHASDPTKNKEFVGNIVRELGSLLNRFYKQNDIDVVLK